MLAEVAEVDMYLGETAIPRDELKARLRDKVGVVSLLTDRIDGDVLDAAPSLRVIANHAVGFDNIDVPEATRRGIAVTNTPGVLTDATADLAFSLLMAVARRLVEGERMMREGRYLGWDPMLLLGRAIAGRTLGIVGLGRIGRAVAERASGFRMPVLHLRRGSPPLPGLGSERWEAVDTLDELLARSDFVSLHTPLTPETRHIMGAAQLERMKPSAYLINTARGPLVDEPALAVALKAGRIAGAALDVFEDEPRVHPALLECDSCLLVPHIGSATMEARGEMSRLAAEGVIHVLRGTRPPHLLNPEVLAR